MKILHRYTADGDSLAGADLTRANLTRANLTGANLTGVNLTGVIIWLGWELRRKGES